MIPVQTIKVCILLVDLPNDSHCGPDKKTVITFASPRIADHEQKNRRLWGSRQWKQKSRC
jgi:hypothetical protein